MMNVVLLISADAEWRAVRELFPHLEVQPTPFGESASLTPGTLRRGSRQAWRLTLFHGGWGKISAAADWESGAIAWVAKRNGTRLLILRGVTDLVGAEGGEAYGDLALFHERTKAVMKRLFDLLTEWAGRTSL